MNNEHDIVDRLRSVGGYFDAAALKYVSCSEAADEIERLRNALLRIECEPINAEYIARAALDGPNVKLRGARLLARPPRTQCWTTYPFHRLPVSC